MKDESAVRLVSHDIVFNNPVYPAAESGKQLKHNALGPQIYINSFINIVRHHHRDPSIQRPYFGSLSSFEHTLFSPNTHSLTQSIIGLTTLPTRILRTAPLIYSFISRTALQNAVQVDSRHNLPLCRPGCLLLSASMPLSSRQVGPIVQCLHWREFEI
jgi:hypothetical protein